MKALHRLDIGENGMISIQQGFEFASNILINKCGFELKKTRFRFSNLDFDLNTTCINKYDFEIVNGASI